MKILLLYALFLKKEKISKVEWRFKDEEKTIEIGSNFIIAPPWLKTDKIKISLVKGESFGTGVHETTVSCMEILESLPLSGKRVLDIGVGSGILSIASIKLGAKKAFGFDIERYAIEECIKNCKLNNIQNVTCFVSDTPATITGQFDVILANIFADIIINMSKDIDRLLKVEGYALFSGVAIEDNFTIQMVFNKLGFKLIKNEFLNDYTTLLFKKVK